MSQRRTPTPAPHKASPEPVLEFNPGDPVEVLPDKPGLRGAHFTAVVVARSTDPLGYTIEYDTRFVPEGSDRPLREVVPTRILRPQRPPCWAPGVEAPKEHDAVDALLDGAWWLAVADGNGKVRVCFPDIREVVEFDATEVAKSDPTLSGPTMGGRSNAPPKPW
ncbi:hypothetical protein HU200_009250 [Digitaria exilis]|uniref:Agenet-like domain-containing protein n=1 Tax=Digitaria exilis TaxID=1010633 RepID=A0A835KNB4_9POAL|nr:hypothetical protein HU200_009250 [Digitaria exilis]